jgi:hypothetical protein
LQSRSNSDSIATTVEHGRRQGEGRPGGARGEKKTGSTGRGSRVEKGGIRYPPKNRIKNDKTEKKKRKALNEAEKKGGKEEKRR